MRVLYLMHVNWYWIRQRPHVFAEGIAQNNELLLLHFAMYRKVHRSAEDKPDFRENVLWRLPERIIKYGSFFAFINFMLLRMQLRYFIRKFKPDAIWITHPVFEKAIRKITSCDIIYDCMDDHLEFDQKNSYFLADSEKRLVRQAKVTIFSSVTLANRVKKRSPVRYATIINNGVSESLIRNCTLIEANEKRHIDDSIVFGYFGTISHWFDWKLVFTLLDSYPTSKIRLAGPIETKMPSHPRIEYVGILPHKDLSIFVNTCHVLIMPFIVNKLIEAVDPVKLYEYIAFERPALAPRYLESERFIPWVHLYDNVEEAISITKIILKPSADHYNKAKKTEFLRANSWHSRCQHVSSLIEEQINY